jgi:hypothetical protein
MQCSGTGQVFVAGDTKTTATEPADFPAPNEAYDAPLNGKESWSMVVPYGASNAGWQLWRGDETTVEHDYGNTVMLFRRDSTGTLRHNRMLVFGGRQPGIEPLVVQNAVEEFVPGPGGDAANGVWRDKTPMLSHRIYSNAVVLPDGKILIVGGNREGDGPCVGVPPGPTSGGPGLPEFRPELYDPGDLATSPGATEYLASSNNLGSSGSPAPRMYHSMAMLLPDARVFVVGGRVFNNLNCAVTGNPPIYPDSRLNGEIFYPPYLFDESDQAWERPSIDGLTLSNTSYQQLGSSVPFKVEVTTQAGPVGMVSIIRPAAITHHFDGDQRFIELGFTGGTGTGAGQEVFVSAPTADMAPQGYYMLFILERKPSGRLVPAIARFVRFL